MSITIYYGTLSRIKFVKRIQQAYKAGRVVPITNKDSDRKMLILLGVISAIGISSMVYLIITKALFLFAIIAGIFLILITLGLILGLKRLIDIENSLK
jgi:hypothetical protein